MELLQTLCSQIRDSVSIRKSLESPSSKDHCQHQTMALSLLQSWDETKQLMEGTKCFVRSTTRKTMPRNQHKSRQHIVLQSSAHSHIQKQLKTQPPNIQPSESAFFQHPDLSRTNSKNIILTRQPLRTSTLQPPYRLDPTAHHVQPGDRILCLLRTHWPDMG